MAKPSAPVTSMAQPANKTLLKLAPTMNNNNGFRASFSKTLHEDLGYYAAKITIIAGTALTTGSCYLLYNNKKQREKIVVLRQEMKELQTALTYKIEALKKLMDDQHTEFLARIDEDKQENNARHDSTIKHHEYAHAQNEFTHEELRKIRNIPLTDCKSEKLETLKQEINNTHAAIQTLCQKNQESRMLRAGSKKLPASAPVVPQQEPTKSWTRYLNPLTPVVSAYSWMKSWLVGS
ncbi:MAG: hypothetical protein NTX86_05095 [Candidatus Dependentiae bacterium]|nr:hypothetical protein [Candidatus Dependentiae bacterium]